MKELILFLPKFVGRYLHEIFGGDELILRKVKIIIIVVILFFERINSIFIHRLEGKDMVMQNNYLLNYT